VVRIGRRRPAQLEIDVVDLRRSARCVRARRSRSVQVDAADEGDSTGCRVDSQPLMLAKPPAGDPNAREACSAPRSEIAGLPSKCSDSG
jgi:hypothetical protein